MSDERAVTINLPLVQTSGNVNSSSSNTTNGNGVNNQQTPQTPTGTTNTGGGSTATSGGITIQTALPGSSSFSVGTKANQSIITDAPVTDPGGGIITSTKQVNLSKAINKLVVYPFWLFLFYFFLCLNHFYDFQTRNISIKKFISYILSFHDFNPRRSLP